MTRVKISVGILSAMIIASILSGIWINKHCDRLIGLTEKISSAYIEGDLKSAQKTAEQLEHEWDSFRGKATMMIKSDKLSEIERLCERIIPLIENDSDEIGAELDELCGMLTALRKGELPLLTSVL